MNQGSANHSFLWITFLNDILASIKVCNCIGKMISEFYIGLKSAFYHFWFKQYGLKTTN